MSFERKSLSVIAYANGFTLWHYITSDVPTTVDTIGYFNEMIGVIRKGDIILANCDVEDFYTTAIFAVTTSDETGIDIANSLDLSSFNSG